MTIEERAKSIYGQVSMNGVQHYNIGIEHYIQGATEQYKIDIDKACEWLCADCIRRCTCQLPKEECSRLMSLRKAMEE